mgnify:CR=1 FL=1
MRNGKIFCLCLDNALLKKVKNLDYIPVGLGLKKFSSEWLTDKDGENISNKNYKSFSKILDDDDNESEYFKTRLSEKNQEEYITS